MIITLLTFVIAGIIKGAIGSGVPVVVVPVLTMLYDVKLAIAVLVAPNLFSNALQVWQYRQHLLPLRHFGRVPGRQPELRARERAGHLRGCGGSRQTAQAL